MPNLERRLETLEHEANKGASNFVIRLVAGEPTEAQKAEHAAIRATGAELMIVQLVGLKPRIKVGVTQEGAQHV